MARMLLDDDARLGEIALQHNVQASSKKLSFILLVLPAPETPPCKVCTSPPDTQFTEEQIAEFQEAFDLFCKGSNGLVAGKDLGTVLRSLGQNPTDEQLRDMLDGLDCYNGFIDFPEFLSIMGPLMQDYDEVEELIEAFKVFDKGENGLISHAEARYILSNLGDALTDPEADEIIMEVDYGNGEINYEELARLLCATWGTK